MRINLCEFVLAKNFAGTDFREIAKKLAKFAKITSFKAVFLRIPFTSQNYEK